MIDGFYIIKDGLPLYSIDRDKEKLDETLVGGFLTAIVDFSNDIQHGESLKQMIIGNTTFSFTILKGIIFVFRQKDFDPTLLQNLSKMLIEVFFIKYESILEDWKGGDTSYFKEFDIYANNILEHYVPDEFKDDPMDYISLNVESGIIDKMKQDGILSEEFDRLCKICRMEIMVGIEEKIECSNRHPVHDDCLKGWLNHSNRCPSCRVMYSEDIINSLQKD